MVNYEGPMGMLLYVGTMVWKDALLRLSDD